MSAAALYERISDATCAHHGFSTENEREQHIVAIVQTILKARGLA